ncbi:MAG: alpha/beta hydrolase fold [Enterovirga sp.]|jgi:pimeloyl-ACP methyl ester carboxylesterase|nr:alpha/beta hydrolase fold [Enterovirga sp.]
MSPAFHHAPRFTRCSIELAGEPGALAAVEIGRRDRPVDVVFLHANGFNALTYRSALEPLGGDLRILAYDQRGHGGSTVPTRLEGRRSWDDLASDLVAVLDSLDGPPVTLAGHSMGGTAAALAAARRPERVRHLTLFDPVILPPVASLVLRLGMPPTWIKSLRDLAAGALRRKREFPSHEAAQSAYTGRGAFRTWQAEALGDYVCDGFHQRSDGVVELACAPAWEASNFLSHAHDIRGALKRLSCPVTILRAERNSTCEPKTPLSGRMTIETVPGTTHFLPMERPDLVRSALRL